MVIKVHCSPQYRSISVLIWTLADDELPDETITCDVDDVSWPTDDAVTPFLPNLDNMFLLLPGLSWHSSR